MFDSSLFRPNQQLFVLHVFRFRFSGQFILHDIQLIQYSHTFVNEVTIDNAYISHAASTHGNQLNGGRHGYTIEIKKKLSKKCLR